MAQAWRKRGPTACRDRSSRPHKLPWKASQEEQAIVCALRRAAGFPLDDLTFVVTHFLPHLGRGNVYRILEAAGLSRRPTPVTCQTALNLDPRSASNIDPWRRLLRQRIGGGHAGSERA